MSLVYQPVSGKRFARERGGSVQEVVLSLEELPGQMALMCCYDIVSHLLKESEEK